MEKSPKYISPNERDYDLYHDQLRQYNQALQRRIADVTLEVLGPGSNRPYAFASTGSDGRLEKGPQSKIEIVVYEDRPVGEDLDEVMGVVINRFGDLFGPPEIKLVGREAMSCYGGDPKNCYPTRVLDSQFLYGNPEFLMDARKQMVCELGLSTGKRLIEKFAEKAKRAKRITRTGKDIFKGRDILNFDLESGKAFYDCENSRNVFRGSFKYGPLRAVQYGLALELVRQMRDNKIKPEFLEDMPQNICERLFFLEAEGRTRGPHEVVEDLADSYKFFLKEYHRSQEAYRNLKSSEIEFNIPDVKKRLEDVVKILDEGILNS